MALSVSVITPTFNSSKYIVKTIESVKNQVFTDWEYIIIDDCSTDDTVKIVSEYCKIDSRIKLICLDKNQGAAIARNRGIENALGRYIAFLDSDDRWHKDKLELQLRFMKENNNSFSFTNYTISNNINKQSFQTLKASVFYKDIIKFNYIPCSTVIFDQQELGKHYMPNIRGRQDWGLWITLLKEYNKPALRIDKELMDYTVRTDSISSNKLSVMNYHWFIYRKFLKFNIIKSIFFFSRNVLIHTVNLRR